MFDPTTLVGFHTWLSLISLVAGFPVTMGLMRGHTRPGWTGLFLSTAFATSATGFAFPFSGVLPSHVIGAISLLLLVLGFYALYVRGLTGGFRRVYAITAMLVFYLLAFVGLAQAFLKVPGLHALAPTQSEPPFAIAQGLLLAVFAGLTWLAARRFTRYPAMA